MKRKIFILCLILSAGLLLTGCGKNNTTKESSVTKPDNTQTKETKKEDVKETTNVPEDFNGSAEDLMKRGKPVKCTAKYNEGGVESNAVYYIDSEFKKMRIIAKSKEKTGNKVKELTTNMITDEKAQYTWLEGDKTGLKFETKGNTPETTDEIDAPKNNEPSDGLNNKMEFKCEKWNVDKSIFEVPGDVQFNSLDSFVPSKQMQGQ